MWHVNLQRWRKSRGMMLACHAQSWLVSLFLDCPPNMGFICPSDTAKRVRPISPSRRSALEGLPAC